MYGCICNNFSIAYIEVLIVILFSIEIMQIFIIMRAIVVSKTLINNSMVYFVHVSRMRTTYFNNSNKSR